MSEQRADPIAGGPPELPLLPRGAVVFIDLPARALVLEALAPAIGHGILRVRGVVDSAVILVRDGALYETHVFGGAGARAGADVIEEVRSWDEADVSADRLDPALVDLCAALLRGEPLYEDLRLEWTSWPALLADLGRRDAGYVVDIATPSGRGVTCIAGGRQLLSYTDVHPSLDEAALLAAMAAGGEGELRVRRVPAVTFAAELAAGAGVVIPQPARAPRPTTPSAGARRVEATAAAPPTAFAPVPAAATTTPEPVATSPAADALEATAPASAPEEDETGVRPAIEVLLPDLSWVAPWQATWRGEHAEPARDEPVASTIPASGESWPVPAEVPSPLQHVTVAEVHTEFREIAQRRLQMSASRVEVALDSAASQDLPLERVLDDLRSLSIRGVMQPTIDAMVDEMTAAAGRRAG